MVGGPLCTRRLKVVCWVNGLWQRQGPGASIRLLLLCDCRAVFQDNGGLAERAASILFSRKDRALADVIGFLEARIAEDESAARVMVRNVPGAGGAGGPPGWSLCPARVLAECAAKRKILGNIPLVTDISSQMGGTSQYVLMCLASVYSQHPDYQEGWRVDGLNESPEAGSQRLSGSGTGLVPVRSGRPAFH